MHTKALFTQVASISNYSHSSMIVLENLEKDQMELLENVLKNEVDRSMLLSLLCLMMSM